MKEDTRKVCELLIFQLRTVAEVKGITQIQIAEITGLKQANVSRFFKADPLPELETFISIARALEIKLFFDLSDMEEEQAEKLVNMFSKEFDNKFKP